MKTEELELKSKNVILEGSPFDYTAPESMEEALEVDGEEKIFKLYMQQRKIRWMDSKRREVTGGGLPKQLADALKSADPAILAAIAEKLGVTL